MQIAIAFLLFVAHFVFATVAVGCSFFIPGVENVGIGFMVLSSLMLANIIQAHFGIINDWPGGAALSISMMGIVGLIAVVYIWLTRMATRRIA